MTIEDIKTLESLFIVEMHSAERIFRLIESGMADIYRESKDYKALVKKHGKPAADQIVRHYTHQVLTQDEQFNMTLKVLFNNLGRIASGEKQL